MFKWESKTPQSGTPEGFGKPESLPADTEEITSFFQMRYPVMLDGALPQPGDQGHFIRQAKQTLSRGGMDADKLPAAVLRETLASLSTDPRPATRAGLTAIGPRHARVWWDEAVLDDLDDVIGRLDQPRPVLRFYDISGLDPDTERWNEIFDVDVQMRDAGKTVQFWSSDRTYIVDLGFIYADGRFLRLARTTPVDLPRDYSGEPSTETVRSALKKRPNKAAAFLLPDAQARSWAAARPDFSTRDLEAELVVHMLYRSFLEEGPRALRRAPTLSMRDAETLSREFGQRRRSRAMQTKKEARRTPFLVARLDTARSTAAASPLRYGVLPGVAMGMSYLPRHAELGVDRAWYWDFFHALRRATPGQGVTVQTQQVETHTMDELEVDIPFFPERSVRPMAAPVFEAAQALRDNLAGMRPVDAPLVREAFFPASPRKITPNPDEALNPSKVFGGFEAKRFAKAGVRITRMALTLEGRMRPNARLKVAGKLVHADADGNFRLECTLSGRRATIPMRAGTSIGGEARSLISVDWEKRPQRERKKAGIAQD